MNSSLLSGLGLVLIGLIGLLISHSNPSQIERFLQASPLRCPFRTFTGLKCAFCGMTHAGIAIFKGNWNEAYQQNALSIPLFISTIFYFSLDVLGKLPKFFDPVRKISVVTLFTLLSIYAVLRNV